MSGRALREELDIRLHRRLGQLPADSHRDIDLLLLVGQVNHVLLLGHQLAAQFLRQQQMRLHVDILVEIEPSVRQRTVIGRRGLDVVRNNFGPLYHKRQA